MDHVRKLIFSSYVHLLSIKKISQYCLNDSVYVGEVYIYGARVLYLSFGTCWDVNIVTCRKRSIIRVGGLCLSFKTYLHPILISKVDL